MFISFVIHSVVKCIKDNSEGEGNVEYCNKCSEDNIKNKNLFGRR
jgi:hypothetical protein